MDIKTHKGEPFDKTNNFDKNVIVFFYQTNIDFLCKSETIHFDNTGHLITVRNYLLNFL